MCTPVTPDIHAMTTGIDLGYSHSQSQPLVTTDIGVTAAT